MEHGGTEVEDLLHAVQATAEVQEQVVIVVVNEMYSILMEDLLVGSSSAPSISQTSPGVMCATVLGILPMSVGLHRTRVGEDSVEEMVDVVVVVDHGWLHFMWTHCKTLTCKKLVFHRNPTRALVNLDRETSRAFFQLLVEQEA